MVALLLFETRFQCKPAPGMGRQPGRGTRGTGKTGCEWGYSLDCREAGIRRTLTERWKNVLASSIVTATLASGAYLGWYAPAQSGGETRTIAM